MNLQDIFYLTGIIFMTLYILLFIAVVILLFFIKKKLAEISEKVEERYEAAKNLVRHPQKIATHIGAAVAEKALTKAEKLLQTDRKDR